MDPNLKRFSFWYFLLAFMGILAIQSLLFKPHQETLSYSTTTATVLYGGETLYFCYRI
ncbi:MAG: hypothetical protein WD423_06975 [Rhodothermales bacterium]